MIVSVKFFGGDYLFYPLFFARNAIAEMNNKS